MLHAKIFPILCSGMVVFNALYIFINSIYPLIADNHHISQNLTSLKFDTLILLQEGCAYCLLVFGIALLARSKIIWSLTVITLIITLLSGIWIIHSYHSNLLLITSLVLLFICFRAFAKPFYLSYGFVFAFAFLIFALIYGILGSYVLRNEFHGIQTINDAIYFCIVTYSTVGFGDIYPITKAAKYFVISMIMMGIMMFTSGITLVAYLFNNKLRRLIFNINKGKISMTNHVVLFGYGILAKILIEGYVQSGKEFIVVDSSKNMDTERESLQENQRLLVSPYPGNRNVLTRARISEANLIIVNFESDSDTIFAIMHIAEFLNNQRIANKPKVLARIYYEENISKAKLAGADIVIAPHLLAAAEIRKLGLV